MESLSGKAASRRPLNLLSLVLITMNVVLGNCDNLRSTKVNLSPDLTEVSDGRRIRLPPLQLASRLLPAVATAKCTNIRQQAYKARFDLNYEYRVEIVQGINADQVLPGIHDAIVNSVVSSLDGCDAQDQPMYQVDSTFTDVLKSNASCAPLHNTGNSCHVVDASTAIFLDRGATAAKEIAYVAIRKVLANATALALFTPYVARARFVKPDHERLSVLPTNTDDGDNSSRSSATIIVVIAFASVFFVITCIFSYGVFRRKTRPTTTKSRKTSPLALQLGIRSGNYFERMIDDGERKKGSTHVVLRVDTRPSAPSVSDITSDSGRSGSESCRSGRSILESPLSRITEENSFDCSSSGRDTTCSVPESPLFPHLILTESNDLTDEEDYGPVFLYRLDPTLVDPSMPPSPSKEAEDARAYGYLSPASLSCSSITTPRKQQNEARDESPAAARLPSEEPRDDTVNQSPSNNVSDQTFHLWLTRLLLKLHVSQKTKRIEL